MEDSGVGRGGRGSRWAEKWGGRRLLVAPPPCLPALACSLASLAKEGGGGGDGLLRIQARESYANSLVQHPLVDWEPAEARLDPQLGAWAGCLAGWLAGWLAVGVLPPLLAPAARANVRAGLFCSRREWVGDRLRESVDCEE